jgi:hypothetical protein
MVKYDFAETLRVLTGVQDGDDGGVFGEDD